MLGPIAAIYLSIPEIRLQMNMEVRREQRAQVTIPTKEVFKCRVLTMVPHTCHQENNPGRTLKGLFLLKDIFRKDTLVQKKV